MQEKFQFILPDNFVIPATDIDITAAIQKLFEQGNKPYNLLLQGLTEENRDKFGSTRFYEVVFGIKHFDTTTLTGRIRISYNLEITFSCSAIVNDLNNQHSYWNFKIDPVSNTAFFEGDEYGDLRSTSNEF